VTNWTNIVIMFELAMLGAAIATVITLSVSARIPRRLPEFYDPLVSQGKTFVGVKSPTQASTSHIEQALRSASPEKLRIVEW
jgi:hypothetical protein